MSAKDYVRLRPALQPALALGMRSILRDRANGLDIDRLMAAARTYFEEEPRTFDGLRTHLARIDPNGDARAMAYAVRTHLPLVQVPTESTWAYPGAANFAVAESWLDASIRPEAQPHTLVSRYLQAFGPASASDAQTWSGLKGLKEVFAELRPKLRVFRDERGRELFDLPRAPRPPADTAAPVRFIPDYDNLILSHADRTRLVADEHRPAIVKSNLRVLPTFLVDGFVAGTWTIERKGTAATVVIEPFGALSRQVRAELADEAERFVRFAEDGARTFELRFGRNAPKKVRKKPRKPA